ncbi:MAG TPA: hypothetical protein VMJ93_03285 [Verrucomicrobiae bacterium]|nr:hypothetical protein [Verrucomicrobiae bacterium]
MQGEFSQIVALTTYGNWVLQGRGEARSLDLLNTNNSFSFCASVQFVELPQKPPAKNEKIYAADPRDWLDWLCSEGVASLRLSYLPSEGAGLADRLSAAFAGGGGRRLLEASSPAGCDFWQSRWLVGDRNRPDRKIWNVTYFRIARTPAPPARQDEDLAALISSLKASLEEIAEFSRSTKLDNFTRLFEDGLSRLVSPTPLEGLYLHDIAPADFLSLDAARLIGASEAAWVFGGMGSWNDQFFEGAEQERYEKLSEKLYSLINHSIVAAANSTGAPPPPAT